jgi:hypothetical protein
VIADHVERVHLAKVQVGIDEGFRHKIALGVDDPFRQELVSLDRRDARSLYPDEAGSFRFRAQPSVGNRKIERHEGYLPPKLFRDLIRMP